MTSSCDNLGFRYQRVASGLAKKMRDGVDQPGERLPRQPSVSLSTLLKL